MALKIDDKDQKPGSPRAAPGLVGPGAQGAQSAPIPGSVADISSKAFAAGPAPQAGANFGRRALAAAQGVGDMVLLPGAYAADAVRAGTALITGNQPGSNPGGTLAATDAVLREAGQNRQTAFGGVGNAIQRAGSAITGTQPLAGVAPASPPAPTPASAAAPASGVPLLSAQNPISAASAQAAAAQPAAPESGIYRSRQNGVLTFSDQPSQGAQPYTPSQQGLARFAGNQPDAGQTVAGGGDVAAQLQRFIQQSAQDHRVARAQQAQDFASGTAAENQIAARNALENAARNARINAGSLRLVPGGRTQRQLLAESADFTNRAAGIQAQPPDKDFITSPQDEAEIDTKRQQADTQSDEAASRIQLQGAQAQGQRIGNQGATREQSLLEKFATQPRDQQQTTISELLLRRGQNPNTSDYDARTVGGGVNDLGQTLPQSVAVLNKRTGRVELVGGAQQGAAPRAGEVQDGYRFKGGDPADQKNWEKV